MSTGSMRRTAWGSSTSVMTCDLRMPSAVRRLALPLVDRQDAGPEDLRQHGGVVEDEAAGQRREGADAHAERGQHEVQREDHDEQRDRPEELDVRARPGPRTHRWSDSRPTASSSPTQRGQHHPDGRDLQGAHQGPAQGLRDAAGRVEQHRPALRLQLAVAPEAEQHERDDRRRSRPRRRWCRCAGGPAPWGRAGRRGPAWSSQDRHPSLEPVHGVGHGQGDEHVADDHAEEDERAARRRRR